MKKSVTYTIWSIAALAVVGALIYIFRKRKSSPKKELAYEVRQHDLSDLAQTTKIVQPKVVQPKIAQPSGQDIVRTEVNSSAPKMPLMHIRNTDFMSTQDTRVKFKDEDEAVKKFKAENASNFKTPEPIDLSDNSTFSILESNADSSLENAKPFFGKESADSSSVMEAQGNDVLEIDAAGVERLQSGEKDGVVMFTMQGCPMCSVVLASLKKTAKLAPTTRLVKIDDTKSQPLWKTYNISSFPTIIGFKNGTSTVYSGDYKNQSLYTFICNY